MRASLSGTKPGTTPGPSGRIMDVIELLAAQAGKPLRYIDIVNELNLNQGTAHTILKHLTERGWLSRDAANKSYTLGPTLAAIAANAHQTRPPLLMAARETAHSLALELGFATSVVERIGTELIIADAFPCATPGPRAGMCIPYAPPYGVAFAAFAPQRETDAWLARRRSDNPAVKKNLLKTLTITQQRGFDVDWTTPAVSKIASLANQHQDLHPALLAAMDQILLENTNLNLTETETEQPVISIVAPVLDENGHALFCMAIHPMRSLSLRKTLGLGKKLMGKIKGMEG